MGSSPSSVLVNLVQLAGRVACLIVVAWFIVFALDQTSSASARQQNQLIQGSSPASSAPAHQSSLHRTLDDTAEAITSPFAGVVSGSQSQWTTHAVRTLLALLVYGFGLGFLVRYIQVRV